MWRNLLPINTLVAVKEWWTHAPAPQKTETLRLMVLNNFQWMFRQRPLVSLCQVLGVKPSVTHAVSAAVIHPVLADLFPTDFWKAWTVLMFNYILVLE